MKALISFRLVWFRLVFVCQENQPQCRKPTLREVTPVQDRKTDDATTDASTAANEQSSGQKHEEDKRRREGWEKGREGRERASYEL